MNTLTLSLETANVATDFENECERLRDALRDRGYYRTSKPTDERERWTTRDGQAIHLVLGRGGVSVYQLIGSAGWYESNPHAVNVGNFDRLIGAIGK